MLDKFEPSELTKYLLKRAKECGILETVEDE